ncbi:MAG: NAD(P)-binding domain-containing protein [Polyangiaceae bacterium]
MKKIGVIGSGVVGQVLADGFLKHGYEVMRGTRDLAKLADWKGKAGAKGSTGTMAEAAKFGDAVVLAVKGSAALDVVKACGTGLDGKPVLDATNPIADDKPPVKGVLRFFTDLDQSLMEQLQAAAPAAHFVKCFSSVGNVSMINPDFGGPKPSMFICGNDAGAKEQTKKILDQFGWSTEDMGAVEAARAIEPLCMLWCIPGLSGGKWDHAFHLLRK